MAPLLLALLLVLPAGAASFKDTVQATDFLRGNLHSHSNESDGDVSPAQVLSWYKSHGYAFAAVTDHDKLILPPASGLTAIPGVEVTSSAGPKGRRRPVHANALCATTGAKGVLLDASHGEVLRRTIEAARGAGGLVAVNHPTYHRALSDSDLLSAPAFELLEIASGHPDVPNGAETLWDALLTAGKPVFAVAADDSHDFASPGEGRVPGQAWVEAWSSDSSAKGICAALSAGHFYAAKGAKLTGLSVQSGFIEVTVSDWDAAKDTVEFIGSGGRVLAQTSASPALYAPKGGEGYVRARIKQSDGRLAWTQAYSVSN